MRYNRLKLRKTLPSTCFCLELILTPVPFAVTSRSVWSLSPVELLYHWSLCARLLIWAILFMICLQLWQVAHAVIKCGLRPLLYQLFHCSYRCILYFNRTFMVHVLFKENVLLIILFVYLKVAKQVDLKDLFMRKTLFNNV